MLKGGTPGLIPARKYFCNLGSMCHDSKLSKWEALTPLIRCNSCSSSCQIQLFGNYPCNLGLGLWKRNNPPPPVPPKPPLIRIPHEMIPCHFDSINQFDPLTVKRLFAKLNLFFPPFFPRLPFLASLHLSFRCSVRLIYPRTGSQTHSNSFHLPIAFNPFANQFNSALGFFSSFFFIRFWVFFFSPSHTKIN